MKFSTNIALLFIEPKNESSDNPLIDSATRKMSAALRLHTNKNGCLSPKGEFIPDTVLRGFHICGCKAGGSSASHDYVLPNGIITNSLCIHYLAYHRDEVPEDALTLIESLDYGEAEPTSNELEGRIFLDERIATR